jgi:hypothetical protein
MVFSTLMTVSLLASPPGDVLTVTAQIAASKLEVGQDYAVELTINLKEGWNASQAGIPHPVLQIQVPSCVELVGKVLTSYNELKRNEFLQEPFERLIKDDTARIVFVLLKDPAPGDQFALNVLGYVSDGSKKESYFVRRRLLIPVAPNALSMGTRPTVSDWGREDLLQIGHPAEPFELPTADGTLVSLAQYAGKKNVIVTTYRAFW